MDKSDPKVQALMLEGGNLSVSTERLEEINAELTSLAFQNEKQETAW